MPKHKFPIKSNSEIPRQKPRNILYPWHSLEIGQSFVVPLAKRNAVTAGAWDFGKRHGRKFTIRTTPEGVQVWRTK